MTVDMRFKLTDEQVSEMRALRETGQWTQEALAERFGISQTHVNMILRGMSRTDPAKPVKTPECADCLAEGVTTVRPIVSGTRVKRCATHTRAAGKRASVNAHGTAVQRQYGLSPEQYWALYELQGRRCAIAGCRATGKVKRLAVDHDHETGEVRGLLCGPHNQMFGRNSVEALVSMLQYLHDPPARRLDAPSGPPASTQSDFPGDLGERGRAVL